MFREPADDVIAHEPVDDRRVIHVESRRRRAE
jgi:hypothetical protein